MQTWGNLHQKPARISRVQSGTTSSTARYVVDGWDTSKPGAIGSENFDVVLDLDGSNAVTIRRVFGSGFDDLVAREDASGVVKWYGTDHLGSVRAIFDNSGGVSNAVDYDAFGGILSGVNVDRYSGTGREADSLTGLRHNRAREYDPSIGRWYSEDPIGFAAGDANLHRYVGNEATGATDPSGYQEKRKIIPIGSPSRAAMLSGNLQHQHESPPARPPKPQVYPSMSAGSNFKTIN